MASGFGTFDARPAAKAPTASTCRTLGRGRVELRRGRHRWRFTVIDDSRASARRLLASLARLAESPGSPIDWFDAAIVAEHLSQTKRDGTGVPEASNKTLGPTSERED